MEVKTYKEQQKGYQEVLEAHQYLKTFLNKFHEAKRGGMHDFIEVGVSKMINHAIGSINEYLESGHKQVNANELIEITIDSFQRVLDGMKRNIESMKQINLQ